MRKSKIVFIMGPPRSGTTALTRLLMSHPSVHLADAKALKTVDENAPTYYESAIFFRDIPDDEILKRFEALDGSGEVILEKTPTHFLHFGRIKKLFPEAFFLMTHREPYDCMCSWKVASQKFIKSNVSFQDACRTWKAAIDTGLENVNRANVSIIDYDDFMANKNTIASEIFAKLGLDRAHLESCLKLMDAPETERIADVVGETIRGGNTKLSLLERWRVHRICVETEKAWQAAN